MSDNGLYTLALHFGTLSAKKDCSAAIRSHPYRHALSDIALRLDQSISDVNDLTYDRIELPSSQQTHPLIFLSVRNDEFTWNSPTLFFSLTHVVILSPEQFSIHFSRGTIIHP